jgi:hypothetical protein
LAEDKLWKAEYVGSGTFVISKPKRKKMKARQSDLKNPRRGSRKEKMSRAVEDGYYWRARRLGAIIRKSPSRAAFWMTKAVAKLPATAAVMSTAAIDLPLPILLTAIGVPTRREQSTSRGPSPNRPPRGR